MSQLVLPGAAAVELTETPFFAQRDYQCGPAALATVLGSADATLTPDDLVDQVYVPDRQGSLQVELLAATRRAGRIPYVIDPSLEALTAELQAGRPVLVLQNLGLGMLPAWHYAVVVGLDPAADQMVLRSGTERRLLVDAREFVRSWRLAGFWAMVVLRPGETPAAANRERYLHAVALAERQLPPPARRDAFRAALALWPDSDTALFGHAFALHSDGDLLGAEAAYRELITRNPRHAAGYNNLSDVLRSLGCFVEARRIAQQALDLARSDYPDLVDAIRETYDAVPQGADEDRCRAGSRMPNH